jgi:serine/threonine protein kinase
VSRRTYDTPESFFDADTRVVDIDAELVALAAQDDDFSSSTTAVTKDAVYTNFEVDPDARTRVAQGSNPPMPLHAAMTAPMPKVDPTRVRLVNPDSLRHTGPTSIRRLPAPAHPPIEPTQIKQLEGARRTVDDESTELRPMTKPAGPYCPVGAPQLAAYQIVRQIALGGMGIVYEAYHRGSGQRVAVKYMRRAAAQKHDLVQRFLAEAVAASRIEHPGVAEIYDYGHDDGGIPYLVMEYLDGECLAERLGRGPLSPGEFVTISRQIAHILEAAHRAGIVHRDLKPDNVFLMAGPGPLAIKVLDFGVAKFQANDLFLRATQAGQMLGTPYYMSPEQCAGAPIDHRSDVYALGCVMYQMLTGRVPFSGNIVAVVTGHRRETPTPIASLNPMIPEALIGLIESMMAKPADDRPQHMVEVTAALDIVINGPPPARDDSQFFRQRRDSRHPKPNMVDTIDSTPGIPLFDSTAGDPTYSGRTRGRAAAIGVSLGLILVAVAAASIWLASL